MKRHDENLGKWVQGGSRPCFVALAGSNNNPKVCVLNYECFHCPFDQWLDELDLEKAEVKRGKGLVKDILAAAA